MSETETASTSPSVGQQALAILKVLLFAAVLGFVGWALVRQLRAIDFSTLSFRWGPVAAAVVCLAGVSVVQAVSYRALLGAYAHAPPWRAMAAVAWIAPLGKYVPGKVAAVVGAVYMLRRFGVSGPAAVSVVLALDGLAVIAGLICGSPLLLWEPVRRLVPGGWAACAVFVAVGVACLHPRVFTRVLNIALEKTGRPPLPRTPRLRDYAVPVLCAFAQWGLAGLALWWMTRSVSPIDWSRLGLCISIAAMAMTVSYLALFAPGGLGVREAIYLAALTPLIGPPAAIVVAAMRLAQTLVEVVLAGVGMVALRAAGGRAA